jgi:hypothetical protein
MTFNSDFTLEDVPITIGPEMPSLAKGNANVCEEVLYLDGIVFRRGLYRHSTSFPHLSDRRAATRSKILTDWVPNAPAYYTAR